jgi:hypothetical protein
LARGVLEFEVFWMSTVFKTSVTSALAIVIGAGAFCAQAAPIDAAGEFSRPTNLIFHENSPASVTFSQYNLPAVFTAENGDPYLLGDRYIDSGAKASVEFSAAPLRSAISTLKSARASAVDSFDSAAPKAASIQTSIVSEVPESPAAWQSLPALFLIFFLTWAKPRRIPDRNSP